MLTRNRRSRSATSVMPGIVLAVAIVFVMVGGSANAAVDSQARTVPSGDGVLGSTALLAPFPSPLAVVHFASLSRSRESSFGSFPEFGDPQALTVDQSSGDVYVVSPAAGTVSRFTAAGEPDNFTAGVDSGTNTLTGFSFDNPSAAEVAVAPSGAAGGTAGDVYVASFAGIDVYASDGTHLGQITQANGSGFSEACGVATDSTGKVYVGDYGGNIDRYVPSANPATNTDYDSQIAGVSSPCNLAADSTGAVYASTWSTGPLTKYTASDFGTSNTGTLVDSASRAVAVDPATDQVYVDEGNKVSVFSPTGTALYSFGSSEDFGTKSAGVAVVASHGRAYVADPLNHQVDVYSPPPPPETTGNASNIHHLKATLNGHVDPYGGPEITDCHFDWGETNTYGNTIPCEQGNNYTEPADATALITGLEPGKTYHFRIVVTVEATVETGGDQTFEAEPIPVVHKFTSTFGVSGSGDGQLSGNSGLAVDQASGAVYVADTSNHRVEKFDSSGAFISAFGWGVKDGKPEAQTCTSGCQTGISGSGTGQLATPVFIGVDNSGGPSTGDVYVGDTTNNTVIKFDAVGNYISTNDGTASGTAFGPLAGVAVDSSGDLWVYDTNADMREFVQNGAFTTEWNSGFGVTPAGIAVDLTGHLYIVRGTPVVEKLTPIGSDIGQISGPEFTGPTTGFAINQATGDLFIDDGGKTIRLYPGTCDPSAGHCANTDSFGANDLTAANGVAVNNTTDRVYVSDPDSVKIFEQATPPDVTTDSATAPSGTSATLTGTVGPNGLALTDCHFEYVSDAAFLATGFADLSSGGTVACSPGAGSIAADLEDHAVTATLTGLHPATIYHFRLVAANAQTTADGQAAIVPGPPLVETTGSPTRTTTTARLDSRLDPREATTTYRFEYGDQGPCDSNPCTSTPIQTAGNGDTFELVSQQITGLKANTTYHYRLVAENGIPNGTANGQDATIATRASDAPLTHGHLPGPPASDRAWEQVNIPDTGGSQVNRVLRISDNGERVVYAIDGGSPGSQYGGGLGGHNNQYAERTSNGWQNDSLYPKRSQAPGNAWALPQGRSDLSELYDVNSDVTSTGPVEIWRLMPGTPAQLVLSMPSEQYGGFPEVSADGSRVVSVLKGSFDPAHPVSPTDQNLYDITTGIPRMVGLLPDGSVPVCGIVASYMRPVTGEATTSSEGWLTPDGSHAFFGAYPGSNCSSQRGLYVRDLIDATTVQLAAKANFIRSTDGAAYFTTRENLASGDSGGNDIYRYTIQGGNIECLTCSTPAAGAVVNNDQQSAGQEIAVSDDGSRIYFMSNHRLLQGATGEGIYRLHVPSGSLTYIAPGGGSARVGDYSPFGNAINPDGSVFIFHSENAALNAVNGAQNGGTLQDYRYDDRDGSLVCVSCPPDGGPPRGAADYGLGGPSLGPSGSAVDDSGDFFFLTPTPLAVADQNTAPAGQSPTLGDDVYEWRDGRLLLVTDGQTLSTDGTPEFMGASPSGRDVFFTQAARLTPDAIDAQRRLYDSRVGGGFDFPQAPAPCSLEACQGVAAPPPSDGTPASLSFSGPGNQTGQASSKQCGGERCVKSQPRKRCAKGKVLKHGKCVKKRKRKRAKRANHNHGGAK